MRRLNLWKGKKMNENDLIAEFIKEKYPELLKTYEFAYFRMEKAAEKLVNDFLNWFEENKIAKTILELLDKHETQEGEEE